MHGNAVQAAGFYALVVSYRLAPPNLITDQHPHDNTPAGIASGRPPQQTDDLKALVKAGRADPHCKNSKVGIVAGSAEASHAAFVALDTTSSQVWPFGVASDRPDFVACLSGIYDLSDRDGETLQFVRNIENYTNTRVRFNPTYPAVKDQWHVSAIAKVTSDIKPMFFINSEEDSVPWHQIIDISCVRVSSMILDKARRKGSRLEPAAHVS